MSHIVYDILQQGCQMRDNYMGWGSRNSFIAIHAEMMVDEALCPVCADVLLKYYDLWSAP